jgi:hypothetical protein
MVLKILEAQTKYLEFIISWRSMQVARGLMMLYRLHIVKSTDLLLVGWLFSPRDGIHPGFL